MTATLFRPPPLALKPGAAVRYTGRLCPAMTGELGRFRRSVRGGWAWCEFLNGNAGKFAPPNLLVMRTSPSARYFPCGCCDSYHAAEWAGDCREDSSRFAADELDWIHGAADWTETEY